MIIDVVKQAQGGVERDQPFYVGYINLPVAKGQNPKITFLHVPLLNHAAIVNNKFYKKPKITSAFCYLKLHAPQKVGGRNMDKIWL